MFKNILNLLSSRYIKICIPAILILLLMAIILVAAMFSRDLAYEPHEFRGTFVNITPPRQSFALQNFATPLGKGVTPPSQANNLIGGVIPLWSKNQMDIYIKPKKKVSLSNRPSIVAGDVCDIVATKNVTEKIKKLTLVDIDKNGEHKKNYLISVTDIIKVIKKAYPDYTVNNVGEMDTLVNYAAKKSPDNPLLKWLKVAFVTIVLLFGSSTAIMSFHTDGQIPKIFERYYHMFYGEEKSNPAIVNVPYSLGLAVGIIVFYNHFMGKKLTDDPTPIEVEMEKYDKDVTEAMVDMINQKRDGKN